MNLATTISTQGLTRRFGELIAVDGVDLRVAPGQFFGFLGPNGAGKSTTIKMLTGLLAPSSGRIEILGLDLEKNPVEVKRQIGVVPEGMALFGRLTGSEFLNFAGRMYGLDRETAAKRAAELLDFMQLADQRKNCLLYTSRERWLAGLYLLPRTSKQYDWIKEHAHNLEAVSYTHLTIYSVDPLGLGDFRRAVYYEEFLKGVSSPSHSMPGNLGLPVLAVQTGGRVLNLTNDITTAVAECVADANSFYVLSFDSPRADKPNEYHSLAITVDKPGITARTRTGYYAQP